MKRSGGKTVMSFRFPLIGAGIGLALWLCVAFGQPPQGSQGTVARDLFVTVGKSLVIDSPVTIERVSVANGELAEAVAVTPREVLVNGKAPGETSLIIWQQGGNRLMFDVNVRPSTRALEAVRNELQKELPGQNVNITLENNIVFLRGTVDDLVSADRAVAIASTLGGKATVNLLKVKVPPIEPQVLLKVRFADVDRSASQQLGANIFSTGAGNTIGSTTTGSFSSPKMTSIGAEAPPTFTLTDVLQVFLFRRDLNLGATIEALQARNLLQILAEPNVLAINGKQASFLAGGEFPFPVVQGGAAVGAVTIQFREFGVRITFTPNVTPRGTIRLTVTPEVSSLDFANGLVFQGFNIPAISTRRVQTEIELESGQSFGIGGLLDNRTTESLSKIPGLGDIPLFGKLFQSRTINKNKTELLVLVTPEIVRPMPAGQPLPDLQRPKEFLKEGAASSPRTPGIEVTGPVPVQPPRDVIPVEELIKSLQQQQQPPGGTAPAFSPSPAVPNPPSASPSPATSPAAKPAASVGPATG